MTTIIKLSKRQNSSDCESENPPGQTTPHTVSVWPEDPKDFTAAMDATEAEPVNGTLAWTVHDLQAVRGQLLMIYRMGMSREDYSLVVPAAPLGFTRLPVEFPRTLCCETM